MFKCFIPPVSFGDGLLDTVGASASKYSDKALLAIDPFLDSIGVSGRIASILEDSGVSCVKWTEIQPNPHCFSVDKCAELARAEGCGVIVACGGGSTLDFGKAVSIVSACGGHSWDYTERADHNVLRPDRALPVIAIPTTSGTGSEVTPFAVMNNPEIREKSTIITDLAYPHEVIVDPEMTHSIPPKITASTGFDAFAHALESFMSIKATPYTKMVATEAMRTAVEYLPQAVANGDNAEARAKMSWASLLGGSAIAFIGVTLPHSIGQPVGGLFGVPHGESVSACTVEILKRSYLAAPKVFAEITDIIEPSLSELTVKERAAMCPELVEQFMNDIGLHIRYSDYGMTKDDIDKATHIALTGYYFDIKCHPWKVGEKEIREIFAACI